MLWGINVGLGRVLGCMREVGEVLVRGGGVGLLGRSGVGGVGCVREGGRVGGEGG